MRWGYVSHTAALSQAPDAFGYKYTFFLSWMATPCELYEQYAICRLRYLAYRVLPVSTLFCAFACVANCMRTRSQVPIDRRHQLSDSPFYLK